MMIVDDLETDVVVDFDTGSFFIASGDFPNRPDITAADTKAPMLLAASAMIWRLLIGC